MSGVPRHTRVQREGEGLYVGYLYVPGPMRQRVALIAAIILVWLLGASVVIALMMREPGPAVWDTSTQRVWEGTLVMKPYPTLVKGDEALLVVGIGKFGVHDRLRPHDGSRVRLSGFELRREGRRMIELGTEEEAVEALAQDASIHRVVTAEPKAFSASGEIVDGKCFLGAMKPGDGMGHRACAVLCIQGGLPPMLTYDDDGRARFALLVVDGQAALDDQLLGFVAQRVRVRGTIRAWGNLDVLRVDDVGTAITLDD